MQPRAVAIVLARAGSKGLPGKNTRAVAGRPCLWWTLEDARRAETIARTVLSSDDDDALAIAREHGAETVRRAPDLATDTATVDDAARWTLDRLDPAPDPLVPVVLLYANVPVRPHGLIDRAVRTLVESGCDSVQSYTPVGKHHPWWIARVDEQSGRVRPWEGDVLNHGVYRRQDLPPAFIPDGAVIALTQRALRLRVEGAAPGPHAFFGVDRRAVVSGEGSVVDIDAPHDLAVADAMLRERQP